MALQEAVKLAKDQHSALRLFHVVDLTMAYSAIDGPYIFEYREAMEAEGKKVTADCSVAPRAAGIEFDSKCVVMLDKHIYDAIEEEAIAWAADLIVIGTHGRKGVRQRCGVSSKPVLLIREA